MQGLLEPKEVNNVLSKFGKYMVTQSRTNLSRKDKNVKKKLYNSLKYSVITNKRSFSFSFEMEDYGKFQDSGVKGATSSEKAPNSPYRFGSGTGRKGGLTQGIREWVNARRFQFRDRATGRFMSYEQTAFLITRSVYNKGIEPSRFFSRPFELGFAKLPQELIEAYGLDIENFLKFTIK
jgi:hypothetical protein